MSVKVKESDARLLLKAVGFNDKIVNEWTVERLAAKLSKLSDHVGIEKKPKDKILGKLFADVMTAADEEEDVVVVAEKKGAVTTTSAPVTKTPVKGKVKSEPEDDDEEEEDMGDDDETEDAYTDEEDDDTDEDETEDGDEDVEDEDEGEEDGDVDVDEDGDGDDDDTPIWDKGDKVTFTDRKKIVTGTVVKTSPATGLVTIKSEFKTHHCRPEDLTAAPTKKSPSAKPTPVVAKGKTKPVDEDESEDEDDSEEDDDDSDSSEEDDDDEDTTDSDDESDDEEDEEMETKSKLKSKSKGEKSVPAKAKPGNVAPGKKAPNFQGAGGAGKPGVIDSIVEFLEKANEQKPLSKPQIVSMIKKRFPDKEVSAIESTVGQNIPTKLRTARNLDIKKNEHGYWIKPKSKNKK